MDRKGRNKNKKTSLALGEPNMDIFWPAIQVLKQKPLTVPDSPQRETLIYASTVPEDRMRNTKRTILFRWGTLPNKRLEDRMKNTKRGSQRTIIFRWGTLPNKRLEDRMKNTKRGSQRTTIFSWGTVPNKRLEKGAFKFNHENVCMLIYK